MIPAGTSPESTRLPTGIGAIIMAGGIFAAAALQRLPQGELLVRPMATVLIAGWMVIAGTIVVTGATGKIGAHTGPVIGSFAIGTWVAASAVAARMAMLAAPAAPWFADLLFTASVGVWLWFIPRAMRNFGRIMLTRAAETRPTGVVLLTTVATQAVALLVFRLFPAVAPVRDAAVVLIGLGVVCYAIGVVVIFRRYTRDSGWRLATDWDNTNCILHGALSITGLTAVVSGRFETAVLAPFWALTLAVFIVVETIEVMRLIVRVRAFGWREAVLVYDTSQWARNFTFGMFYAFTSAFVGRFDLPNIHPAIGVIAAVIVEFGQYVVLALLLAELALVLLWLADGVRTAASYPPEG